MKKLILIYLLLALQLFCNAQVTDIDGNTYQTQMFGNQIWMIENLITTHLNDGNTIINYRYLTYNINNINNKLCPIGWHIPNTKEWELLEMQLNNSDDYYNFGVGIINFRCSNNSNNVSCFTLGLRIWACADGDKFYKFKPSQFVPYNTYYDSINRMLPAYSVRCTRNYDFKVNLTATDTTICREDTVKIHVTATGENPPFTYTWGTGEIGDTIITVIPQYTYSYHVTVRDSLNQVIDKKITISVSENPEADFTYTLNSFENSGEFLNTTKEIRLNMETFIENSYEWQFEETQPNISQSSSNATKPITYIFPGFEEYYVTLWATNTYGCSDSITKIINTTEFPYISVPSAFSPNNDGLNDVLYAVGRNIENITFIIYDRWGQKVFESNSLTNGWDGTFNGKPLEAAVYMYYISGIATYDEKKIEQKGDITIIK